VRGGSRFADVFFNGPIIFSPELFVIGVIVAIVGILILKKIGWPNL
jgi:hypothetical protein